MIEALVVVAAIGLGWAIGQGMKRVACPLCSGLLAVKRTGDRADFVCCECDFTGHGIDYGGNYGDSAEI